MLAPTKEQLEILTRYNATYRFNRRQYPKVDAAGKRVVEIDEQGRKSYATDEEKSGIYCEIIDLTISPRAENGQSEPPYWSAKGESEAEALANALAGLPMAPKPLTPAQQADPAYAAVKSRLVELENDNRALRTLLMQEKAKAKAARAARDQTPKKRGRPAKVVRQPVPDDGDADEAQQGHDEE